MKTSRLFFILILFASLWCVPSPASASGNACFGNINQVLVYYDGYLMYTVEGVDVHLLIDELCGELLGKRSLYYPDNSFRTYEGIVLASKEVKPTWRGSLAFVFRSRVGDPTSETRAVWVFESEYDLEHAFIMLFPDIVTPDRRDHPSLTAQIDLNRGYEIYNNYIHHME